MAVGKNGGRCIRLAYAIVYVFVLTVLGFYIYSCIEKFFQKSTYFDSKAGMCNNIEIEPNIEIEIAISRRYWDRGHIEIEEMKNELLRLKLILQKAFQKYWCWDWYCTKEKFKLLQYFLQAYVVTIAILLLLKNQYYCKRI